MNKIQKNVFLGDVLCLKNKYNIDILENNQIISLKSNERSNNGKDLVSEPFYYILG